MSSEANHTGKQETASNPTPSRADPKLLELLVCPLTRTTLAYDAARQELISRAAGLAYPIRNGVPMMTPDAARPLDGSDRPAMHAG